jgi:hypothetical protein
LKKSLKAAMVLAAAGATFIGGSAVANAVTIEGNGVNWEAVVVPYSSHGSCESDVDLVDPNQDYATGIFNNFQDSGGTGCTAWLEYRVMTNGSWGPWQLRSGYHEMQPGGHAVTYNYWDGPDYRTRACVQMDRTDAYPNPAAYCSNDL